MLIPNLASYKVRIMSHKEVEVTISTTTGKKVVEVKGYAGESVNLPEVVNGVCVVTASIKVKFN
jgi:hypothetical protein